MKITEIIVEGYKEAQIEFGKVIDPNSAQQVINQYKELVQRNQVQGQERNIDFWRKQGWDAFQKFVSGKISEPSKTQIKRKKVVGKSLNLIDNDEWLVVVPLDKDASCFHGKNSDWCTTKTNQSHFEDYFYDNNITLIYCLNKQTGGMWAIAAHKDIDDIEMFDQKDASLSKTKFIADTGFDPTTLVAIAKKRQHSMHINASRTEYKQLKKQVTAQLKKITARDEEIEKNITWLKEYTLAKVYIKKFGKADYIDSFVDFILSRNGEYIQFINDPNEQQQLMATRNYGKSIRFIDNPSEKVQFNAVNQDGHSITHIKNPSEAVQLAAVKQNGTSIAYIDNPSFAVQLAAIKHYPNPRSILQFIKKPDPRVIAFVDADK